MKAKRKESVMEKEEKNGRKKKNATRILEGESKRR